MARPFHKPTDESRKLVEAYAKVRVPQDRIATLIGITEKTLTKHYKKEITDGHAFADSFVLNQLFQGIKKGNVALIIFYCKTILKMKETQVQEVLGEIKATGWGVNIIAKALPKPDE